ncbi:putative gas vesicle synthesis protein [Actinacidiphila reveromycinica]|uniref:Gas vesicle protein A n=1 Tax=Actinacidiphila reveromycinica TaxID=659352 RepID=A0A7U3UMS6_9ACTN|nr:gas vesicle protein GvpJ [Streptomyces sp. SN-593]BBA95418.1 putative gas vesicle synthesis protein [Streptomyces sp. SN-593]
MTVIADDVVCAPRAGTLYDVLDLILDRGMVIDVFVRVSLVGIEILKIDARIVVASVDTYLRFAEACNRLNLESDSTSRTVPELFGGASAAVGRTGAKKAARSVGDKVKGALGVGDDEDQDEEDTDEEEKEPERPRRRTSARRSTSRARHHDEED